MSEMKALIVAGTGEATSHDPALFEAKIRATVRYADPVAWITGQRGPSCAGRSGGHTG